MTQLAVRAVMTADNTGLVSGAREAQGALDNLKGAHSNLSGATRQVANDTGEMTRQHREAGLSAYELDRAMTHLGGTFGYHTGEVRGVSRAMHELIEGYGLLGAASTALGAGLVFSLGQTVLFKGALETLWGTLKDGVDWFDKLISGKRRWDAAMAAGPTAQYDPAREQYSMLSALSAIDASFTAPERSNTPRGYGANALPFANNSTQTLAGRERARGAILDKLFPEINVTASPLAGDSSRVADEIAAQRQRDYAAELQWNRQVNESQNGFMTRFRPGGITPFDTANERAFAYGNPGGVAMGGGQSQRVNDARATREEISRIEEQGDQKDAEEFQKFIDEVHKQNVTRMDDLRKGFADFGTSAVLNFKNAGQAAQQFLQQLAGMVIQMRVMQPLAQSLFGAQGTGGGGLVGDFVGSLLGNSDPSYVYVTPSPAGFGGSFHSGGIVGTDGGWRNARRYHSGGVAGDEVPVIAQRGEGIFTPAQMAALGKGMSPSVVVNVHNNAGGNARVQQSADSNGNMTFDVLIDQIDNAMADRTQRGGSQFARQMQSSFNLSRTPG